MTHAEQVKIRCFANTPSNIAVCIICYHKQNQNVPTLAVTLAVQLADGRKLQSWITLKDNDKEESATRCLLQMSGEGVVDIVINSKTTVGLLQIG